MAHKLQNPQAGIDDVAVNTEVAWGARTEAEQPATDAQVAPRPRSNRPKTTSQFGHVTAVWFCSGVGPGDAGAAKGRACALASSRVVGLTRQR